MGRTCRACEGGVDVQGFDVFLCHNSEDKAAVKKIGKELEGRGVKVWLDDWELRPGVPWQRALEEQIEEIKAAAVFVGERGIGPWQQMEVEAFLREFVSRGCAVVPVILKKCKRKPRLPVFSRGMGWVDLRKSSLKEGVDRLVWGITGRKEGAIRD
ncbi:MAG: toll/interleukin-1 receptor domain-containing protein [Planctomycetota bacterium]